MLSAVLYALARAENATSLLNILLYRALIFHSECGELSNEIKKHKNNILTESVEC